MKVWIAVADYDGQVAAFISEEKPALVRGSYMHGDNEWACVCLKWLRKIGVRIRRGQCKQYEIPLFREVKPRKRKARR